jgi:hypothetical protein
VSDQGVALRASMFTVAKKFISLAPAAKRNPADDPKTEEEKNQADHIGTS